MTGIPGASRSRLSIRPRVVRARLTRWYTGGGRSERKRSTTSTERRWSAGKKVV